MCYSNTSKYTIGAPGSLDKLHQRLQNFSTGYSDNPSEKGKETISNTVNLWASWSTYKPCFSSGPSRPHCDYVAPSTASTQFCQWSYSHWLLHNNSHSSTNKKFTGKWKLPCGHSHIVKQAEGDIIKLTHICSTDAFKQNKRGKRPLT